MTLFVTSQGAPSFHRTLQRRFSKISVAARGMSKKDKRRRESRRTDDTGWLGDERGPVASPRGLEASSMGGPEGGPQKLPRVAELAWQPGLEASPTTRRSTEAGADEGHDVVASAGDAEPLYIPKLAPLSLSAVDAPSRADDLGDETAADIAPIGPTEVAAYAMESNAASSSFGGTSPQTPQATSHADDADKVPPRGPSIDSERNPSTSGHAPTVEQLEQHIRDLEAKLDAMIQAAEPAEPAPPARDDTTRDEATRDDTKRDEATRDEDRPIAAAPVEQSSTARELLPAEFYLKQWGRSALRSRTEEVDEFGLDPKLEARLIPSFDFLYKHYFRVSLTGAENVPKEGRCLMVANHSGGPLPYDGLMLRTAVRLEVEAARELRWLAEDFLYYLPFAGTVMNRLGAVRACQENAERLLAGNKLVAVFPEGVKGIGKLFRDRYKLQRFGRGGFIRLCLRTRTPIIPAAIVGAEEANPMLYRVEYMAKALGLPYLPVTPTFPALGALGLVPAPTKWRIAFGEPIRFDGYGPEAADDEILVGRLSDRVRATIQAMLDRTIADRRSIWF